MRSTCVGPSECAACSWMRPRRSGGVSSRTRPCRRIREALKSFPCANAGHPCQWLASALAAKLARASWALRCQAQDATSGCRCRRRPLAWCACRVAWERLKPSGAPRRFGRDPDPHLDGQGLRPLAMEPCGRAWRIMLESCVPRCCIVPHINLYLPTCALLCPCLRI